MSNFTKYSIQLNHAKDVGTISQFLHIQSQVHILKNKEPMPTSALPNTPRRATYKLKKLGRFLRLKYLIYFWSFVSGLFHKLVWEVSESIDKSGQQSRKLKGNFHCLFDRVFGLLLKGFKEWLKLKRALWLPGRCLHWHLRTSLCGRPAYLALKGFSLGTTAIWSSWHEVNLELKISVAKYILAASKAS